MTDKTTDGTTSHLTNPAKDAGQVIGYSHSTKPPKNGNQVAGYAALRDTRFFVYQRRHGGQSGALRARHREDRAVTRTALSRRRPRAGV